MSVTRSIRLLFALVVWAAGTPLALACSCSHPDPMRYLASADLIFRGKASSIKTILLPRKEVKKGEIAFDFLPSYEMRATFKISEVMKGPRIKEVTINYLEGGDICGWRFFVGKEVVVFASKRSGSIYQTGMCKMIPYSSYTSRDDMRYANALDEYVAERRRYVEALRAAPENWHLRRSQAAFHLKFQDLVEADEALSALLKHDPGDIAVLIARGDVRQRLARPQEALADFRAVIAIDPNNFLAKRGQNDQLARRNTETKGLPGMLDNSANYLSLKVMDLSSVRMFNANFNGMDFFAAQLTRADIQGGSYVGASFAYATLDSAQISGADFSDASLESAYLRGAKLHGVNLSGANLKYAVFHDACFDLATVWPKEFDPLAAGAKLCD